MIKSFRIIFLLVFGLYGSAYGQLDSVEKSQNFPQRVYYDASHAVKSVLFAYARPFSWDKKDWTRLGITAGSAVAVSFLDDEINAYFLRNQTHFQDQLASVGDFMGQPEYQGPSLLAFFALGVSVNDVWVRRTTSMLAASMAASGIIQTFSKEAVGRARPDKGVGSKFFKPFGGRDYHSFPSGHTMLALSSSWILARQVKAVPLKVMFYSVTAIVGWSRVYDNAHWTSDIVLGSALGIATAEAVIRYYSNIKPKSKDSGLTIMPHGNGVSLTYSF